MKKVLLLGCSLAIVGTCSAMSESDRLKEREVAVQELQFLKNYAEGLQHYDVDLRGKINVFLKMKVNDLIERETAEREQLKLNSTVASLRSLRRQHR